ncbi:5-methylcytosine-specific restriction endonuclease McrA [Ereboglobus sp. PH5-5]|uniref:HNH endonuclease n=1 Tax=Ereboglobus luteus TaxID=1796921 RepID=A0A2U8E045_9BACT|nr:HNH endonuclease [Ereboglobus luteus]AWI08227.1 HNH endonuclease [Ereboglobus luteus]MDF9832193.1 5-methylcytosine-specific restriction endonuclease McrA [Ereboglobus sp. PH5-5]
MEAVLEQPVLVLNRLWQAINVIGAKRAFALLARGHAQVVHHHEEDFHTFSMMDWIDFSHHNPPLTDNEIVHTPTRRIRLPRVILLTFFDKLPCKELKLTRNNVFERDKNQCQYCAKIFPREELNLDHVIPRHYNGRTTWENIVCSCIRCNTRKANRLPHEAGMRLIRKPQKPKWRPVISLMLSRHDREMWKDYLDLAYWNVELEE